MRSIIHTGPQKSAARFSYLHRRWELREPMPGLRPVLIQAPDPCIGIVILNRDQFVPVRTTVSHFQIIWIHS